MSNKNLWWLLPVGCAVLVLCIALFVGILFFFLVSQTEQGQPKETASVFLEALKDGHYSTAWSQLSEDLQARYPSPRTFEEKAKHLKLVAWSFRSEDLDDERATVIMSTSFQSSGWEAIVHYPTVLYLKKESGKWKIYNLGGALKSLSGK